MKMTEHMLQMGFNQALQDNIDDDKAAMYDIARVITVHRDSYIICKAGNDVTAKLSGKFLHEAESTIDRPTVGDWIYADFHGDNGDAVIHGFIPRISVMKRKMIGKRTDYQLIAANIDTAFIVQSLRDDFNLRRLERYMVMITETGITPMLLLSKSDLMAEDDISEKIAAIQAIIPDIIIVPFSNEDGTNLPQIKNLLHATKTYCMVGSSGVGKTTLLNSLLGEALFATAAVREYDGKGRHTTTSRQLIQLANGAMMVDTPGMRELGNLLTDSGIDETFSEIIELAQHCKFNDCSHQNEKNCAILAALKDGSLTEARYQSYEKMQREAQFNEMSYVQKKQKGKKFQKQVNSAIKGKRGREKITPYEY